MALAHRSATSLGLRPSPLNTVQRQPHPNSQITSLEAQQLVSVPPSPAIRGISNTDTPNHSYVVLVEVEVSIIQPHSRITCEAQEQLNVVPRLHETFGNSGANARDHGSGSYPYYIFVDVRLRVMSSKDVKSMLLERVKESLNQLNESIKQLNDTLTRLNETLSRMNDNLDTIVNVLNKVDAKLDKILQCVESRNARVRNSSHGASSGSGSRKRLTSSRPSVGSGALVPRVSRHTDGFRGE